MQRTVEGGREGGRQGQMDESDETEKKDENVKGKKEGINARTETGRRQERKWRPGESGKESARRDYTAKRRGKKKMYPGAGQTVINQKHFFPN